HVADDAGRLLVRPVPVVVELVHRVEHPPMHRLEPVPRVRQGPPDDHAHGVIEVAAPHFLFETDGQGFFGEGGHEAGKPAAEPAILARHGCRSRATQGRESAPVLRFVAGLRPVWERPYGTIDSAFWVVVT